MDMVIVIKEKETWSIKSYQRKTKPPIDNYVFKSYINEKTSLSTDNYVFKSLTLYITPR